MPESGSPTPAPLIGNASTALPFGHRARIGMISPTVLEVLPYDFYRLAPPGVVLCGVTCLMEGWAADQYENALSQVDKACQYLGEREVDYLIHVASPLVVSQGPGFDRVLIERMRPFARCPVTTTIRSALDSFAAMGAKRIGLVTPFHEVLNGQLTTYVEAEGYEVTALRTVRTRFDNLQNVGVPEMIAAAREVMAEAPQTELLFLPSGQLPAFDCVLPLEAEFAIPVIAQNQADYWQAFRALGITDIAAGHGRLLDTLRASTVAG
ncbi:maleate cis-trans isomerase family protein [Acuticoccus kandeliae]|uniref:maleate cis-trans isomerase family protein n=1 Tax=Acuticoccus kandeliae TaxID=2073160 RepID=UPI000D3E5B1A|nr:hypothetical protein [Acuticoccus kandeliae]